MSEGTHTQASKRIFKTLLTGYTELRPDGVKVRTPMLEPDDPGITDLGYERRRKDEVIGSQMLAATILRLHGACNG
jgi:hypothetical protein